MPRKSGGYMLGLDNTMAHYDPAAAGKVTQVVETETDKNNQFNDGKCDRAGRIWAGILITFCHFRG